MAITFSKEPTGIYPAYNDSYIEFTSDLSGNNRAEITVSPIELFPRTFSIFPDFDGNYLFNLKEIVKSSFNRTFEDQTEVVTGWSKNFTDKYLLQSISIEISNGSETDTISKGYQFFKAVNQVGEKIHENNFQLLTATKNGIDHSLTYWEGFPFHFSIKRVIHSEGKEIVVRSLNTTDQTDGMPTTETGSMRIQIDKGGGENWTSENFLPLITELNRLEILENGSFRSNLLLKKKKDCAGVYLKWANNQGDYSFWLFDEWYRNDLSAGNIDIMNTNRFDNVNNANSKILSTGKEAERSLRASTRFDEREREVLEGLVTSPFVQMYSSKEANVIGEWINVQVNESIQSSNKRLRNEFTVTIDLPEVQTMKF